MNDNRPIGIFDSGVGGLTVLREMMRMLPNESCVYFGDTARVPYGEKSRETIIRYASEIVDFLSKHDVKAVVVACNTATAYALYDLQQTARIPILGVIEPGVHQAVSVTLNNRIAILATRGTIHSGAYQEKLLSQNPNLTLLPIVCPLLVPLIEENYLHHPATRMILKEYLKPVLDQKVDTVLLGCTHYPLIADLIGEIVGVEVNVIHSATTCAERLKQVLQREDLEAGGDSRPIYRYFVSDDPDRFKFLGEGFLDKPIVCVEKVELSQQLQVSTR